MSWLKMTPALSAMIAASVLVGCSDVNDDNEVIVDLHQTQQELVTSNGLRAVNGLRTINGLRAVNGLRSVNGLSTTNGLRTVNGIRTINGLVTKNGVRSVNGLSVDCVGKELDSTCTGNPDGLLSNTTGMMANDEGIVTASYLVRCALPPEESISVADYGGTLITLNGEIGLTPEWKLGQCNSACEEKISACLMALTNGQGEHLSVELTGPFDGLGVDNSKAFPYQEAAFYGNLFSDPPQAYYCIGQDYAVVTSRSIEHLATRACKGYTDAYGECPYTRAGLCNPTASATPEGINEDYMCLDTKKTLRKCRERDGSERKWRYPITTFRNTR